MKNNIQIIKNAFKNVNTPVLAFFVYVTKLIIFGPTYEDAAIFVCLSAVFAYKLKLDKFKPKDINKQMRDDVNMLKNELSKANIGKIKNNKIRF